MLHLPLKLIAGSATLGVSLLVAFGPYRTRLPRVFTAMARYSAAVKLSLIAVGLGIAAANTREHAHSPALTAGLLVGAGALLIAAAAIAMRKAGPHEPG